MKIQYLIDVKKALKDIPDEVLKDIGWGVGEDSEDISLCVWDNNDDPFEKWDKYNKKYPQLKKIDKWIENIKKTQSILDNQETEETDQFYEMDEPMSSEYKFKKI